MADEINVDTGTGSAPEMQPNTPGGKLRAGREALGLSLPDIATRTRIAQRQLEAIERDDYTALPGIPYAVGFARAYARAIDMDDVAIAADVRRAVHDSDMGANRYEAFEPVDPARVPSRALAWTAAVIVVVLIAGFTIWRTQMFTAPTSTEIAAQQGDAAPVAARPAGTTAPVPPAAQPVVFTAVDDVWLRIYDEAGERLKDGLMKKGETFALPTTARNPMILTGRPQALSVTVGGKAVAPLGAPDRTIADVPVNAEALLARGAATATPAPGSPSLTGTVIPQAATPPVAPSPNPAASATGAN
ncbi:helix-turn-helix domain-containing protein [Sphingobium sp.]|uniref:helix-turn-helix domain-containing protein n=1 Tax=Sphingobium sp. TaxID=1912891 RepID=UPI003BB7261C